MDKFDYQPHPADTSQVQLPPDLMNLAETLAKNVHEVWAANRMAQGWIYGPVRDDILKLHPGLVPYENLSEEEKDFDRSTSLETLRFIMGNGFKIVKDHAF